MKKIISNSKMIWTYRFSSTFYISSLLLIAMMLIKPIQASIEQNNPGPRWGHTFIYDPFNKNIFPSDKCSNPNGYNKQQMIYISRMFLVSRKYLQIH